MRNLFLALPVYLIILSGCGDNNQKNNHSKRIQNYKWTNEILGIPYKISYTAKKDYQLSIDSIIGNLIYLFSEKSPNSIVSNINNNSSAEISDNYALYVLQNALSICNETNHAFDPTVKPLYDLFNEFTYDDLLNKSLDTSYYKNILGCEKIQLTTTNNKKIIVTKKHKDVKITLGGIYKGFIVDKIADFFKNNNITNYYIELGKTPHVKCSSEMNHSWNVIIKEPKTDSSVVYHTEKMVINLNNKGLACSDINSQAYIVGNKLVTPYFSINPIGLAQTNVVNAIVISDETMICDAMATAMVIMGKDNAINYLQNHPELEAIITYIDEENNLKKYITPGVEQIFHVVK